MAYRPIVYRRLYCKADPSIWNDRVHTRRDIVWDTPGGEEGNDMHGDTHTEQRPVPQPSAAQDRRFRRLKRQDRAELPTLPTQGSMSKRELHALKKATKKAKRSGKKGGAKKQTNIKVRTSRVRHHHHHHHHTAAASDQPSSPLILLHRQLAVA